MRLSEAIRLGSMLRPQGFGSDMDAHGNTCAFGAAYQAVTSKPFSEIKGPKDFWPWMTLDAQEICPACGEQTELPSVISVHLNDRHHWTREQIAAWVATIEPKEIESNPEILTSNPIDEQVFQHV